MKNLDLSNYSVQEMNAVEMKETSGGISFIAGLIISIIIAECLDRGSAQDFRDGWNAAKQ